MTRPHVVLACAGLDHAHRGYESFARECFEALRDEDGVRIELVKGSGARGPGERAVPAVRRDAVPARLGGRLWGVEPFRFEHLAFALSLQPVLARRRPDVVFLSEWDTARGLAKLRAITRQRFKLVLSNGGFAADGFEHLDHVQDLTPAAHQLMLDRGADPRRHTMLPLGLRIDSRFVPPGDTERATLRERLALPAGRTIVISVAALNRYHKRLDYLIEEVASLPEPRPFLLMVGQPEAETPGLRALAAERLGRGTHEFRTVPAAEVIDLYRASDTFVLSSLEEAQGRVLIEAMASGLPCLAHDTPVTRFALGEHGLYGDFTRSGTLAALLGGDLPRDRPRAHTRHEFVYERFSWDRLRPRYVELFQSVAALDAGR